MSSPLWAPIADQTTHIADFEAVVPHLLALLCSLSLPGQISARWPKFGGHGAKFRPISAEIGRHSAESGPNLAIFRPTSVELGPKLVHSGAEVGRSLSKISRHRAKFIPISNDFGWCRSSSQHVWSKSVQTLPSSAKHGPHAADLGRHSAEVARIRLGIGQDVPEFEGGLSSAKVGALSANFGPHPRAAERCSGMLRMAPWEQAPQETPKANRYRAPARMDGGGCGGSMSVRACSSQRAGACGRHMMSVATIAAVAAAASPPEGEHYASASYAGPVLHPVAHVAGSLSAVPPLRKAARALVGLGGHCGPAELTGVVWARPSKAWGHRVLRFLKLSGACEARAHGYFASSRCSLALETSKFDLPSSSGVDYVKFRLNSAKLGPLSAKLGLISVNLGRTSPILEPGSAESSATFGLGSTKIGWCPAASGLGFGRARPPASCV